MFSDDGSGEGTSAARDILRAAEDEIVEAIANADADKSQEGIMMRLRCKASPERIDELRQALKQWIDSTQAECDENDENAQEIGALIAFYPVNNENK